MSDYNQAQAGHAPAQQTLGHERAHHVEQPEYFFYIRIAQALLSLLVLILSAAALGSLNSYLSGVTWAEAGFVLFCGIWSLLVIAYLIISSKFLPELYNYWAQAVAEGVTIVFWFAGFIALATTLGAESRPHISWYKTGAAACAFAAFTWVSFVVTGVLFGLALKKHLSDPAKAHLPRSGLPYDPHTSGPAPTSPGNVEMGNVVVANPGPQQQYPMATQTPVPMQTGAPEPYQMQPQSPVYPAQTATPVHMYSPTPPPHGQQ